MLLQLQSDESTPIYTHAILRSLLSLLFVCMRVGNISTTPAYCAELTLLCRNPALRTTLRKYYLKKLFYSSCNIPSDLLYHCITYLDLVILRRQMFKQTTVKLSKKPRSVEAGSTSNFAYTFNKTTVISS